MDGWIDDGIYIYPLLSINLYPKKESQPNQKGGGKVRERKKEEQGEVEYEYQLVQEDKRRNSRNI